MIVEQVYRCPADHPSLIGHFPGNPMVPGAVLLDQAVSLAQEQGGWHVTGVRKARFKTPLLPEVDCQLRLTQRDDSALDLTCTAGEAVILVARLDCGPSAKSEVP